MPRKPGPKSAKERYITKHGTLGESSTTSDTEDSSPEKTPHEYSSQVERTRNRDVTSKSQQRSGNQTEFRSPAQDKNLTDYGLEFTTSRLTNISPRRCSTFRNTANLEENQRTGYNTRNSAKESDPHFSAAGKRPQQNNVHGQTTRQPAIKSKVTGTQKQKKTTTNAEKATGSLAKQVTRKPRKQRTPLQLEQRFWKEVQILQNRASSLIPMLPFSRVVREIMQEASTEVSKITPTAMEALQTSAELYITQRLQDAYLLTLHRGRVTLDVKDLQLITYLKVDV